MSAINLSTWATCSTTDLKVTPVSWTSSTPAATCWLEVVTSALISLAASAERWARARTSDATTAKPRPTSPARAASTPAFSAKRLVWKAISSITPMIWPIWRDDSSMWVTDSIARATTSPDRSTWVFASATVRRAWLAPSAVSRTRAVTSPKAAAACSSPAACCSVRRDRLSEAPARPSQLALSPRLAKPTAPMASESWPSAELKSSRSFRYSSGSSSERRYARSPAARAAIPWPTERTTVARSCASTSASAFSRAASAASR